MSKNFTWLKYATKKEQSSSASPHEAMHLSLTAKAAARYQDAAAMAPGSGTDASISPET